MGGKGVEARIGYPLTATFLASSRGVWVICQSTSNTHTPACPSLCFHWATTMGIDISGLVSVVPLCLCVCMHARAHGFCPECFRLPPAALPPLAIQTASLRGSTLRRLGRGGGLDVCCASGLAWHPLPTLAQHLGGINFLPHTVPALLFCRPSCPSSVQRSKGQQGHFSSFLSSVLAVSRPPPGFPQSGSCNNTHFQIHSISTNVAHLSKGWKEQGERRWYSGKEGGISEKRKMKKRTGRNGWLSLALPFPIKPPFPYSLPIDSVFVSVCVTGQVWDYFKACMQKAQINPTVYVFRN